MAAAMNFFIPNVGEFFETILSFVQPKRNHRLSQLYLCRIHSSSFQHGRGYEFLHCGGILFCLCQTKQLSCLELRDGDQAEFLSRRLEQYEQTLRVMYQYLSNGNMSSPRGNQRFCPRVPVHKSRYKGPNNTQQLTNDS